MPEKYNLSQQEYEIMKILWSVNKKMSLAEISELLHSNGFSITTGTIKTHLQRLIKKGALLGDKNGRNLQYYPSMDETAYSSKWTRSFVDKRFNSSLSNFLLAFTGRETLSEAEKEELKKFLDSQP